MSLRVLMLAPTPFFGDRGCHVRILEEIRALQDVGARVLLLTYPAGKDVPDVDIRRLDSLEFLCGEKVGPQWGKLLLDAGLAAKSLGEASSFGPDIIHGHLHEGCLLGWILGGLLRVPVVFDYQGSLSGEMSHHGFIRAGSLPFAVFNRLEKLLNRLPSAVLASSDAMRRVEAGPESGKWAVVSDAVDTGRFRPMPRDEELARRFELPSDRPVCAFLGLLNTYQGMDLLLECAAYIKSVAGSKALHFLIMGYPGVDYYAGRAKELDVLEHVSFTGRVPYEDAPRYLSLADFAVAPKIATTESNGKVINYMACGLPTVALDTAVNRELLGTAGRYVPWKGRLRDGAKALGEALLDLARDPEERKRLSVLGVERVEKFFGRDRMSRELVNTYRAVLDNRRK